MNLFFEIHKDIPREGPGTNESTKKAFQRLEYLPATIQVLDIGCGPGMQTIELSKHLEGHIFAIDPHEPFLEKLKETADKEGLLSKITAQKGSMFNLEFEESYFDLIWSEGAIFIIGFKEGIQAWRKYLKPEGYLVVSEITWLNNHPATEAKTFWEAAYPAMTTVEGNKRLIEQEGYTLVDHFVIPEEGWWENYYTPLTERIELLRKKYKENESAIEMLNKTMREIDLYRNYANDYGYVFYIMKKN